MSLNFCDVLVVGGDLSGLVAATLLAKRGMNVLILDDEEENDRSLSIVSGLETRIFKGLMNKLMIPDSKLQLFQENEVSCQLILRRHRIDFTPNRNYFLNEIGREFPEDKEIFQDYIEELDRLREKWVEPLFSLLPLNSRQDSKQFSQWLEQLPDEKAASLWEKMSPDLQNVLKIILRFLSRNPLIEPIHLQLMLYLAPENCTTFSLKGGLRAIKKIFYEKLDYFGGLVHPLGANEFKILTKGREVKGVKLNGFNYPTRCRFLIGNLDLQRFYEALPTTLWSYFAKKRARELTVRPFYFTVQFEVPRNFLPEPMRENLVLVHDLTQPLEDLNYLEVSLSPPSRDHDDMALLTVGYRHPSTTEDETAFERIHQEIEKRLKYLIPFAGSSLKRIFPKMKDQTESGALFPENVDFTLFRQLAQKRRGFPVSLFSPKCSTPFKNAFSLGPNLLPWMGTEGKILSGLRGVEMIWERESKLKKH